VLEAKKTSEEVLAGPLEQLTCGHMEEEARCAAVAGVEAYLLQQQFESSLCAAAPLALARHPDARSSFEKAIVDSLRVCIMARLKSLEEKGRDAALASAEAELQVAQAASAKCKAVLSGALAAQDAASRTLRDAAEVEREVAARPGTEEEQERVDGKLRELDEVLSLLDGLTGTNAEAPDTPSDTPSCSSGSSEAKPPSDTLLVCAVEPNAVQGMQDGSASPGRAMRSPSSQSLSSEAQPPAVEPLSLLSVEEAAAAEVAVQVQSAMEEGGVQSCEAPVPPTEPLLLPTQEALAAQEVGAAAEQEPQIEAASVALAKASSPESLPRTRWQRAALA